MRLNPAQTDFIKKELLKKGITNESLRDDLLDHFCCLVEEEMDQAADFKRAYFSSIKKFGSLSVLQADTLESIASVEMLPKIIKLAEFFTTLSYLILSLVFLIMPLYLTLSHKDISFVLFFSPFVILGLYICVKRINYQKFEIIPFQKSLFSDSVVH